MLVGPGYIELVHEVVDLRRLRLRAVQDQELLGLARLQDQPVRVIHAAEAAVVLGQVAVPRGEASRRESQGHAPIGKHFGLQPGRPALLQRRQVVALHLQRDHPAGGAELGHPFQGGQVVQVQVRPGHEGRLAREPVHGTHVVGFDQVLAIGRDLVHAGHVAAGLQQHLGRQHHFLAGLAQPPGDLQPVGQAQLVAARADGLAEVDHIGRRRGAVVEDR